MTFHLVDLVSQRAAVRHLARQIRRGASVWTLLAVVAFPWSCATGPTPMTAQGGDGVCENDRDCQIVDYDVELVSCCGGSPLEPYAVSTAAVERHTTKWNAKCADAVCNLVRRLCCSCTKKSDWVAVCSRHVCQRRSVTFFSPKPSCDGQ